MADDTAYMQVALRLARRSLGRAWPNPAVGCVVVRHVAGEACVIGRGWTQPGGRPHAEAVAIGQARARFGDASLRGATAYVSFEPCSHHGATPPCADALVGAGVARVVIGCADPDRRVSGRGVERLRAAGIAVATDILRDEAEELNAGFIQRETHGRPLVTLKTATSADGRIATRSGASRWITGAAARTRAHLLRAQHDAIVVGLGTVRSDDPELTCRVAGMADRTPVRVVFDSRLGIATSARLVRTADVVPTWLVTRDDSDAAVAAALEARGVAILRVGADRAGHVDAASALAALAGRGITRVMVEGGAVLSAALLRARLIDRIAWFRAPSIIGGDGVPAIAGLDVEEIDEMPSFTSVAREAIGDDTLEIYRRLP